MIPVYQTLFSKNNRDKSGDCLRACICSLLHLTIEEVPHFIEHKPSSKWFNNMEEWLKKKGYKIQFDCEPPKVEYYMVWGMSPRGILHSVIHSDGKLVHDPHPDGGGVIPPQNYVWLVKERKRWKYE